MQTISLSRLTAAALAVLVAAPMAAQAQERKALSSLRAEVVRAEHVLRSGPSQGIGAIAAPGDQIVLSTRTYCFDANGKRVTCPDKITIRN